MVETRTAWFVKGNLDKLIKNGKPHLSIYGRYESIEHTMLFCCFVREVWELVEAEHHLQLDRKNFISTRVGF
jgi:hypothetical protein